MARIDNIKAYKRKNTVLYSFKSKIVKHLCVRALSSRKIIQYFL